MKGEIKVTNPDKIIFPEEKLTKIDLINYYISVCGQMLPFVKNRVLSVIRCHEGVDCECFFKKHPTSDKNIEIFKNKGEEYFYIKNQEQLISQVQNGTIEFHIGGGLIKDVEKPNLMVFDLDPDSSLPLEKLQMAVLKVKSVIDELSLVSFLKTSGGKGYHIVIPFKSSKDWNQFYEFSRRVALLIESRWPDEFTTNLKKEKRKNKIFIDYLRNNKGSTCVAPYSVRARAGASVSMPIAWDELNKIKPSEVNIRNYKKYMSEAWKDFFEINQKFK